MVTPEIINGIILAGLAALGGWSLRSVGMIRRRQKWEKSQKRWAEMIDSEYNRLNDDKDECKHRLEELRKDLVHMYTDGTITKNHFEKLDEQISRYGEGFSKRTPV